MLRLLLLNRGEDDCPLNLSASCLLCLDRCDPVTHRLALELVDAGCQDGLADLGGDPVLEVGDGAVRVLLAVSRVVGLGVGRVHQEHDRASDCGQERDNDQGDDDGVPERDDDRAERNRGEQADGRTRGRAGVVLRVTAV